MSGWVHIDAWLGPLCFGLPVAATEACPADTAYIVAVVAREDERRLSAVKLASLDADQP